jgi:hypothetical protein
MMFGVRSLILLSSVVFGSYGDAISNLDVGIDDDICCDDR